MTASHWRQKQISYNIFFWLLSYTSCANRAQLATAWSTGDTCTVCGHPTMSNYFTMYKIVAALAFAYRSGYHCYYLSDYKLGVHVYCLWSSVPGQLPLIGGTNTFSKQIFSAPFIYSRTSCAQGTASHCMEHCRHIILWPPHYE